MLRNLLVGAVAAVALGMGFGVALTVSRQPVTVAGQAGSDVVARSDRF